MAAGTSAPTPSTPPPGGNRSSASGRFIEYDRYIESQLRRTRRQVKGLDLMAALMLLAAGSMVYFLLAALADHWLVPGGMGFFGRFACLTLYIVGVAAFTLLKLGPLFLRRINPVYAAQAIERNRPGLKNSLVNFLLLRSGGAQLPQRVYEAIEEQAATGLSAANVETALDRGPLVKLLTVLMLLLCAAALYGIFSPKNLFTSFRRVIHPWADISAPTRVMIGEIQPGDAEGYHDQHLSVSALVSGLSSDEAVTVHYSTADGQTVDQRVRMTLPESGYRYTGELPADSAGLQQDVIYWITAGDAISPEHRLTVHTAPSIVVDSVEYDYPAYSEINPRRTPKHGNIQALEGTRVTIRATASHDIRSADLDFDCDGRRDVAMKVDGRKASVEFPLRLKAGTDQPEHESYQLRFRNLQGHENPKPIRYAIEVIRDVPPEVAIVEPRLQPTEEYTLMAGESLPLALTASDPDFKLADVRLHVRRGREKLLDEPLLTEERGGAYRRRYVLSTRQFRLKPGETLSLWAAAEDNRQPESNRVETPHYTLRVVSPDGEQQDDQLADARDSRKSKPNEPQQPGGSPAEEGQGGDQQKQRSGRGDPQDQDPVEGEQDADGQGDQEKTGGKSSRQNDKRDGDQEPSQRPSGGKDKSDRVDPEKDAGRAIDEINKFFDDKQKEKEPQDKQNPEQGEADKRPNPKQRPDKPEPDKRQQERDQDASGGGQGQQPDEKQSAGDDSGGSPEQKQQGGGKSKPKDPGERERGQQGKSSGDQPADAQKPGQEQDSEGQQGKSKQGDERGENMPRERSGEGDAPQKQDAGDGPEKFSAGKQRKEQGEQAGDEKKPGEQDQNQTAGKQGEGMESQKEQGGEKERTDKEQPSGEQKPSDKDQSDKDQSDNEQQPGPGKGGGGQDEGEPKSENNDAQAGGDSGKSGGEKNSPGQAGDAGGSGQERGMKEQPGEKGQQGEAAEAGEETPKDAKGNQRPQPGKGGQSRGQGDPDKNPNGDKKDPNQDVEGGDPEGQDRGEGGAGKAGGNKEPVASPRAPNQQKDKQKTSDDEGRANTDEEGNSGTESDRQSDSESDKSGDMSGGGGQGGGQRSKSPGKGSAGQNTDAEQGGGQSEQTGHGPTSEKGGDQKQGNKRSGGASSGKKGEGSHKGEGGSKPGQGDDGEEGQADQNEQGGDMDGRNEQGEPASKQEGEKKPGPPKQGEKKASSQQPSGERQQGQKPGEPKEQSGKESAEQQPDGGQSPSEKGGNSLEGNKPGGGRGNPTGGGVPGPDNPDPPAAPSDMSEPGGEDPNLEYTRKATELALERLKDQLDQGQPDQDLLDKLKWSREDVEKFVNRWDALEKSAEAPGPQGDAAREELDETLRSLGLRPRGSSVSGGQKRSDQSRNLIESRRSAPPPEYAEQYREFSKGLSKGRK
ncbi:MAG TPA: hypothetical protein VHC19_15735 [Pirellulales bacterium]|nr:hypothetical protein [Pirellulales bacterium]